MNHVKRILKRSGLWLSIATVCLIIFTAWGCSLEDLMADLNGVIKQTTLVIELEPPEGAKIILPDIDLEASLYDIAGTGPDGESFSVTDYPSSLYTHIGLAPGVWTLSATAKNAIGDTLGYSPTVTATLVQAKTTSARLSCLPPDGGGSLAMNLSWPAGAMSAPDFHAVMTSSSGEERTIGIALNYSSATITGGSMSFLQGGYDLEVRMSDRSFGPEPVWKKSARVFIAQGKTTTVTWTMDPSEMSLRPGVRTFAGGDTSGYLNGTGTGARFYYPSDIIMDGSGNLYVADANNHCIRKITPFGAVSTFAGSGSAGFQDGIGAEATFREPTGIAISGSTLYVADKGNHAIRKVLISNGTVTTVAGTGTAGNANNSSGILAQFSSPSGLVVSGGYIYVADTLNHAIRKIRITSPYPVTTLSGSTTGASGFADGSSSSALFYEPGGIAVLPGSTSFVVTDTRNHRIRRVDVSGNVLTLAGSASGSADGTGTLAAFSLPRGIAPGPDGYLYIADTGNNRIRRMSPFNEVTTIAGSGIPMTVDGEGLDASFYYPNGLSVDSEGRIFVADRTGCKIRVILP
ncbi:MAG: hypothetical protein RBT72_05065 [Spirochaetia bacterium]|jgi:sugar lactone lactonase YvrE|nr:hypothetical protein [Spirochaetia bacterium]